MSKKKDAGEKPAVRKADRKTLIGVIAAVVALILVVIMIVILSLPEKFDSKYFHDTNNKIVLTMDNETSALDDSPYEASIIHLVYYHDGTKVNNMRVFYEYPDEDMAMTAIAELKMGDFAESRKLNGRFIVYQAAKSQYEGMTVEDVKNKVEQLKELDALILEYDENTILEYPLVFPEDDEDYEGYDDEDDDEEVVNTTDEDEDDIVINSDDGEEEVHIEANDEDDRDYYEEIDLENPEED